MASTLQPAQVREYAMGLHDYAVSTLEPSVLHSWIIWRLIIDCELEHSEATYVTDTVLACRRLNPESTTRAAKRRQSRRHTHHGLAALESFRHRVAHS